jgi:hypothetical protein
VAELSLGILVEFLRLKGYSEPHRILQLSFLQNIEYHRSDRAPKIVLLAPKLPHKGIFLILLPLIIFQTKIELLQKLFIFYDIGR